MTIEEEPIVAEAMKLIQEERLLDAARLLNTYEGDKSSLNSACQRVLKEQPIWNAALDDLMKPPSLDDGWMKLGESHSKFETCIYYKVQDGAQMHLLMETPIPEDLVVPLLSVLNESSLYSKWIPSWKRPIRLGVNYSEKLLQVSRVHQIIQVKADIPWPWSPRDIVIEGQGVDDIEHRGFIGVKLRSLDESTDKEELPESFVVPPQEPNEERVDVNGALLFRSCPTDHPCYKVARQKTDSNQELILVQFKLYFDARINMVPQSFINFVTRTVIGTIWNMFLKVAVGILDGSRPEHQAVIDSKPEFYQWVKDRVSAMLIRSKSDVRGEASVVAKPSQAISGNAVDEEPLAATQLAELRSEDDEWNVKEALTVAA